MLESIIKAEYKPTLSDLLKRRFTKFQRIIAYLMLLSIVLLPTAYWFWHRNNLQSYKQLEPVAFSLSEFFK